MLGQRLYADYGYNTEFCQLFQDWKFQSIKTQMTLAISRPIVFMTSVYIRGITNEFVFVKSMNVILLTINNRIVIQYVNYV